MFKTGLQSACPYFLCHMTGHLAFDNISRGDVIVNDTIPRKRPWGMAISGKSVVCTTATSTGMITLTIATGGAKYLGRKQD